MSKRNLVSSLLFLTMSTPSMAGYLGGGAAFNVSKTFDEQETGFRVDFGANINDSLDLEWNYVDFGGSYYNDPTPVAGITDDVDTDNDNDSFTNTGYGSVSVRDGGAEYHGISEIKTQGLGAGFKFKLPANDWLTLYARASFLAWKADTQLINVYTERDPLDGNGNPIDEANAVNQNPCNDSLAFCSEIVEGKTHWAVDFWYGYGFLMQPFSWMAIRTEYSITTLNAVNFPKSVIEGVTTSLEVHF